MKCENCGEREAVVHVTKIFNNEKQEYNLCESCAHKVNAFKEDYSFDFHKFFSGLLESPFTPQVRGELKCPLCHMTYSTFKKHGKVGCDQCYNTFVEYLSPLIRRIHGGDHHTGKIPNNAERDIKLRKEIEELKNRLKEAIEREEYELAAKIRDELKIKNREL